MYSKTRKEIVLTWGREENQIETLIEIYIHTQNLMFRESELGEWEKKDQTHISEE